MSCSQPGSRYTCVTPGLSKLLSITHTLVISDALLAIEREFMIIFTVYIYTMHLWTSGLLGSLSSLLGKTNKQRYLDFYLHQNLMLLIQQLCFKPKPRLVC